MVQSQPQTVDELLARVPPIPIDSQLAFYYVVGNSLTQWAMVERIIEKVAQTLVQGNAVFVIGLEGVGSLESKIKFVDAVIHSLNRDELHDRWFDKKSGLRKKIKGYTEIRNKLAHWQVVHDQTALPFAMKVSPTFEIGRQDEKSLTVMEIYGARFKFHALVLNLLNFIDYLNGKDQKFSESEIEVEFTTKTLEDELRLMASPRYGYEAQPDSQL